MTRQEALDAWKEVVGALQPRTALRYGELGDGAGNVDVPDKPGWVWIRYQDNQSRLSMVRCFQAFSDGTPVLVGKWHVDDEYEQVLSINWGTYSEALSRADMARYATQPHGETHHGTYGSDPAYIDLNNLVNGRVKATDPPSLFVIVEALNYSYNSEIRQYGGGVLDVSASVPAGAGHRYVLVYFDPVAEAAGTVDGDVSPITVSPDLPDTPDPNTIPLALLDLANGQTIISDFTQIFQYKLLFNSVAGQALEALRMAVVNEGDVVTHDGEIVWAT